VKTELAKREKEILILILKENSSADIAEILNLSIHTIDTHRKNILRKTKSNSIVALIKYAIREGLIDGFYYQPKSNKKTKGTVVKKI
jgi:two-component system, NarL family, nitrate/nitrite response regulator NarL